MSRSRCFGSFCKQRCKRTRTRSGVSAGSCDQSGSSLNHRRQHVRHRLAAERHLARQHLVQTRSQTPRCPPGDPRPALSPAPGDMYAAVPRMIPACVAILVSVGEFATCLRPRRLRRLSPDRNRASSLRRRVVTFTFAGFRSRCTIPRSCAYSSASQICLAMAELRQPESDRTWMRSASVAPSTSSITSA